MNVERRMPFVFAASRPSACERRDRKARRLRRRPSNRRTLHDGPASVWRDGRRGLLSAQRAQVPRSFEKTAHLRRRANRRGVRRDPGIRSDVGGHVPDDAELPVRRLRQRGPSRGSRGRGLGIAIARIPRFPAAQRRRCRPTPDPSDRLPGRRLPRSPNGIPPARRAARDPMSPRSGHSWQSSAV